jgi:hypothetical protein
LTVQTERRKQITSDTIYTVRLEIEKSDPAESRGEKGEKVEAPLELAAFHTLEEAILFRIEMQLDYSPLATGEMELLNQMTSPEEFTAGD